jgi:hypothetical protein
MGDAVRGSVNVKGDDANDDDGSANALRPVAAPSAAAAVATLLPRGVMGRGVLPGVSSSARRISDHRPSNSPLRDGESICGSSGPVWRGPGLGPPCADGGSCS